MVIRNINKLVIKWHFVTFALTQRISMLVWVYACVGTKTNSFLPHLHKEIEKSLLGGRGSTFSKLYQLWQMHPFVPWKLDRTYLQTLNFLFLHLNNTSKIYINAIIDVMCHLSKMYNWLKSSFEISLLF